MNEKQATALAMEQLAKAKQINPKSDRVALLSNMSQVENGELIERWDIMYLSERELKQKDRLRLLVTMGKISNPDLTHASNAKKCKVVRLADVPKAVKPAKTPKSVGDADLTNAETTPDVEPTKEA